jgi:Nuclease A inhibitor-like protein
LRSAYHLALQASLSQGLTDTFDVKSKQQSLKIISLETVDDASLSAKNFSLIDILKQASDGLLFMSESEYPFEVFVWQSENQQDINSEFILKKTEHSLNTPIAFVNLESFFELATTEQDWHGIEEKETVKKFQFLVKTLKENLTDIKVARLGTIEIDVYIVGKTPDNKFAGLVTKAIET